MLVKKSLILFKLVVVLVIVDKLRVLLFKLELLVENMFIAEILL